MKKLDVRDATLAHDAVFVSSIRTYGNLGPFRPANRADFKGIRLFDLVLRPRQIVCGSTVRSGDPDGQLYGNWGVIIGSGDIQQAFPYDASSVVVNDRASSPYDWHIEHLDLESQVAHAIEYRAGHNEINIALGQGSIAGLFIGEQASGFDGIDLPSEEVLAMIRPLELPLFHLKGGDFYRVAADDGSVSTVPSAPSAIISHQAAAPGTVVETMKHELSQRLLLPPRNAVSAGWHAGQLQRSKPSARFQTVVEQLLASERIDQRYFGSMAVFAANIANLQHLTAFDDQQYTALAHRILPNGMLRASRQDIDYYLETGVTPPYLGEI